MQFSQNQINFAAWCATTGCGVSVQDHLAAPDPLMQSLYYFHVYYQMRRILDEMQTPLPQDAFDNPYDWRVYEQICNEFGISPHTNWHVWVPTTGWGGSTIMRAAKGTCRLVEPSRPVAFITQPKCRSRKQQPTVSSTWTSSRKTSQTPTHAGRRLSSTSQRGLLNRS